MKPIVVEFNEDRLKALHGRVWQFRAFMEEHAPNWTTPDYLDSLLFAVTESAEAIDAELRLNPRYARNHEKYETPRSEWAQCAIMLCTAIGPQWPQLPLLGLRRVRSVAAVCLIAKLADAAYDGITRYVMTDTVRALATVVDFVPDMEVAVEEAITKLVAKHADIDIWNPE